MKVKDYEIIKLFKAFDQKPLEVVLDNNRSHTVFNIAWGYDIGDEFAHITTNISPAPQNQHTIDFFYSNDIEKIKNPESNEILYIKTILSGKSFYKKEN